MSPCENTVSKASTANACPRRWDSSRRSVCHVSNQLICRDENPAGMILGDHPNCRFGVPVTIEWDYVEYEPLSVDDYEVHHALRRPLGQMRLSSTHKQDMLRAIGYHPSELAKARRALTRCRNQRQWTTLVVESPLLSLVDGAWASLKRKIQERSKSKLQ